MSHAKSLYCINVCPYQYYIGREGQSVSLDSLSKNYAHFEKVLANISFYKPMELLPTYSSLRKYYIVTLLRYMLDIHLFSQKKDVQRDKLLRDKIRAFGDDVNISEQIKDINLKGLHYINWWLDNTGVDKLKLKILVLLKKVQHTIVN